MNVFQDQIWHTRQQVTTKWDVDPIIEKKNIDKRVIVLYKRCYGVTYSIKEMAMCQAWFAFHPSLLKRSGRSKGFDVGVASGSDVKGIPTIASTRCNSCYPYLLNCFCTASDFEAWYPRPFGSSLVFCFNEEEAKQSRCVQPACPLLSPKKFIGYMQVKIRDSSPPTIPSLTESPKLWDHQNPSIKVLGSN